MRLKRRDDPTPVANADEREVTPSKSLASHLLHADTKQTWSRKEICRWDYKSCFKICHDLGIDSKEISHLEVTQKELHLVTACKSFSPLLTTIRKRMRGKLDDWGLLESDFNLVLVQQVWGKVSRMYVNSLTFPWQISSCTMWGVRDHSVAMFSFVFFRMFRIPIGLHNSCSISPTAGETCQKCSTKYHDWVNAHSVGQHSTMCLRLSLMIPAYNTHTYTCL